MAASSTAVTVLAPNGRRQTIKVSPNTPLLQVLEDVCRKHGFNPEDHGLKFQRNVLDLTLQWRFANLPNNAKLEVVSSTRRGTAPDSEVRIALQTEDGSRLQGSFPCSKSLWEVLCHFPQISVSELSETGSTPVCVYMRDEVSGEEALKKATLKSLGLTGGSAIVRFLLKRNREAAEDSCRKSQEMLQIPPVAMETPPSPSSRQALARPEPEGSAAESSPVRPEESPPAPTPTPPSTADALPVPQEEAVKPRAGSGSVGRATPEEDAEEAGPSGLNSRPSSSSPSAPPEPFIPFSGGGQRLGGLAGRALPSSSSSPSLSALTSAEESPKAKKAKSSIAGKNRPSFATEEAGQDREEFLEPLAREPLVYHLESVSQRADNQGDLPDEFFEVTVDDVRKRFAQLKSERKLLEEAPLMTKALKEMQMKEKMDKYPKVVLRVQFPDRHVLQGFFRPLETVGALRHFVRSHLEEPQLHFYLFITPPKTILHDPAVTLFQANLFPGALVYFGSDANTECYLKRELLGSSVSAVQANQSIASHILQPQRPPSGPAATQEPPPQTPPPPPEPGADGGSSREERGPSAAVQAGKPNRPDPGKVPKWLKLPGKK